jgi:hypothetical protein
MGAVLAQAGTLVIVLAGIAGVGGAAIGTAKGTTRPGTAGRAANGLLRAGAALLPDGAGNRYAEEWCGEFFDLRADGARWWNLLAYVLGILLRAVPVLAVILRVGRARVVD